MASGESHLATLPSQPFQFTLRQLFLLTVACAFALALFCWWGPPGFVASYFGGCLAAMVWGLAKRSRGWLEGGIVMFIAGLGMSCLIPPIQVSHGPSPRGRCSNHLKQLALALELYHDTNGEFPPAFIADTSGRPMHSWRVLILPFLERVDLYQRYNFNEPWDGPNNSKLHNEIMSIYCCPASFQKQPRTETNYVAVVGPQTLWPGEKATARSAIIDGSTNTIMVVEVHNSGIHWMEPRDLHVVQMPMAVNSPRGGGISSPHHNCALVAFADGHTAALQNDTSPAVLRAALTIAGGESIELP